MNWEPAGTMPNDLEVVIAEFVGPWDAEGTGNGGIRDMYAHEGKWFNIPDSITITRWMHIPE
jgi:hypothetical protein